MLDTRHDLKVASKEIGSEVWQLLTPLTRYRPQYPDEPFAIDNGAFSAFDESAFLSLLSRERPRKHLCKFVAVPDVVGSAMRTLEVFSHWSGRLKEWPLALVAQDGQESLPIPWCRIDAVFIGGSTEWKASGGAAAIAKAARLMGKWCHVGRVNTPGRFEYWERVGADSIDGTGLSRYSWMRQAIYESARKPKLFEEAGEMGKGDAS